jgi:quinol monooxygenase YgiN
MIALVVSLHVVPEHLDDFTAAIRENAERSYTDEPGCLWFDVVQDEADPHHFHFYELYADHDALAAHRAAPHFATWRAAADRFVVPGSQVNTIAERRFHHGGDEAS